MSRSTAHPTARSGRRCSWRTAAASRRASHCSTSSTRANGTDEATATPSTSSLLASALYEQLRLQEPLEICYKRQQAIDRRSTEITKGPAPLMMWCHCADVRSVCGGHWIMSLPQEYVCHQRRIHRSTKLRRPVPSGASS